MLPMWAPRAILITKQFAQWQHPGMILFWKELCFWDDRVRKAFGQSNLMLWLNQERQKSYNITWALLWINFYEIKYKTSKFVLPREQLSIGW